MIRKSFSLSKTIDVDKKPLELVMQSDGLVNTDLPLDMSAKKPKVFGAPQTTGGVTHRKESKPHRHEAKTRVNEARGASAGALPEDFRISRPGIEYVPADNTSPKMMLLKRKIEQIVPQSHIIDGSKPVDKTSTSLVPPIRQTASIFKQSVTMVKPQKSTVRSDMMFGVQDKPKQLFWEKRLQGLTACDRNGKVIQCFELPKKVRAVGLQLSDDTLLRSIATALHLNSHPITGQNKPKPLLDKNPGVYINPSQPLVLGVHVTDEDIEEQEKKVEHARKLLKEALQEHKF